jgi:hypothetical protein
LPVWLPEQAIHNIDLILFSSTSKVRHSGLDDGGREDWTRGLDNDEDSSEQSSENTPVMLWPRILKLMCAMCCLLRKLRRRESAGRTLEEVALEEGALEEVGAVLGMQTHLTHVHAVKQRLARRSMLRTVWQERVRFIVLLVVC